MPLCVKRGVFMKYVPFSNLFMAFSIIGFIISIMYTAYGKWELQMGFALTVMFTLFVIAALLSALPSASEYE
jgi:hypothetical protein